MMCSQTVHIIIKNDDSVLADQRLFDPSKLSFWSPWISSLPHFEMGLYISTNSFQQTTERARTPLITCYYQKFSILFYVLMGVYQ